jgi:hypothetical protein
VACRWPRVVVGARRLVIRFGDQVSKRELSFEDEGIA